MTKIKRCKSFVCIFYLLYIYPNAGIGRQCKLKFCWFNSRERSSRSSDKKEITIGDIVYLAKLWFCIPLYQVRILVSPKLEKLNGWAELWRCLGCKFKSYVEQNRYVGIGRQSLFRSEWLISCKFKSCYLYYICIILFLVSEVDEW